MGKRFFRKLLFGHRADSDGYLRYLRKLGMRIGQRTVVYEPRSVHIDESRPWLIEIGSDVQITRGVTILTHGYEWSVLKGVYGEILGSAGKVTIGNNVFIGMGSTILKGVTIGNHVIIGAGSLVNKDIPDHCVSAGNPARVIMTLEEYHQKRQSAQQQEAAQLVQEYRKVYGKNPDEKALNEFFWLFTNDPAHLPACWESQMQLHGNRNFSAKTMAGRETIYKNMQEFLDHC